MQLQHKPICDPEVTDFIATSIKNSALLVDQDNWSVNPHIDTFVKWIKNSRYNQVIGLEAFVNRGICQGTSQAIEQFILRHHDRRIRFSQDEFVLSRIVCNNASINWCAIEQDIIRHNDALIISVPFSGNGAQYPDMTSLLDQCNDKAVPVLVDAAYFGIANGIVLDITSDCVTDCCFSITKPLHAHFRHGIRFTRKRHDDAIQVTNDRGIMPRICVELSSLVMQTFSCDYIRNKYWPRYLEVCQLLDLNQTNTFTLALGDKVKHAEFHRGNYVRICVTDELMT